MSKEVCIVKGFVMPKRGKNGEPIYAKRFNQEEGEQLYKLYKEFLEKFRDTYLSLHGINKLNTAENLNDFINTLVFYMKSFMILDPIPIDLKFLEDNEKLIPSPTTLLRGLLIAEAKSEIDKQFKNFIKNGHFDLDIERYIGKVEIINQLQELQGKAMEMFYEHSILDFPADTRVGSNTSSLLIHMLTTSAIAVSIYLERNGMNYNSKEVQTLRLTSLFHDIGKMSDWHKHVTISSKFLNDLLQGVTEGEASEIVSNASKIITGKDLNSRQLYLLDIFKEADRLASRSDRVKDLILKLLNGDNKKVVEEKVNKWKEDGYEEPFDKWEFWEQFSPEEITRFTEEFCRNASSITSNNPALEFDDNEVSPINNDIVVARLDFKGIQSFIHSSDIRVMNGGSRWVDLIIFVLLPLYIIKYMSLPAESILYNGGGNLTLVIPKYMIDKLSELKNVFKNIEYGYSYFYSKLAAISNEIDNMLLKKKLTNGENPKISNVQPNIHKRCQSCNKGQIPKVIENKHEKLKNMCENCREKFEIGISYHFSKRVDILIRPKDEKEKILNKILEYIAGHSENEILKDNIDTYKDIAFVKFDGNILGQLMASSISLTDAHERSVRIDYSVKKAFHDFLNKLVEKSFGDYAKQIIMGLMYMGGDDGALIMPSNVALQFALHMINEYNLNMGRKSTLSVGIAVGKPKHPLQLLKEGAEYLLDEVAKDNARSNAYEIHETNKPEDKSFKGALSFYVADGGSISRDALDSIFSMIRDKEHLSIQPYYVTDDNDVRSINRLLNVITQNNNIDSLLEYLNLNEKQRNRLKDVRNACMNSLQVSIDGKNDLYLRVIYSQRDKDLRELVNNLLVSYKDNFYFGLYDLYQLLKVMGVEQPEEQS